MTRIENVIKNCLSKISETVIYYRYVSFYKGRSAVFSYMIENIGDKGRLAYGIMKKRLGLINIGSRLKALRRGKINR